MEHIIRYRNITVARLYELKDGRVSVDLSPLRNSAEAKAAYPLLHELDVENGYSTFKSNKSVNELRQQLHAFCAA